MATTGQTAWTQAGPAMANTSKRLRLLSEEHPPAIPVWDGGQAELTLTVVSLFTGAMGLDLGFEQQGFKVSVALERDPWAVGTMNANRPRLPVIDRDIADVTTSEILEKAGLQPAEATVVTGGPPCEPFSTAGRRRSFQDRRANAILEFIRVINEARPHFFVFEQVPGFLRAAKRHVSFYERVRKREDELAPEERLGSAFDEVMAAFEATGYLLSFDPTRPGSSVLNAADFGTPQKRRRFILVGARDAPLPPLPTPTHGDPRSLEVSLGVRERWVTFREAVEGLSDSRPEHLNFPSSWEPLLVFVPPAGCWRDLPPELHQAALGGAYDAEGSGLKGGRTGFLRRLSWDEPAPTVVDRPNTRASCLCHPEQPRPLSVKEYGRLQGFPDDWVFKGPLTARYQLIGQATPLHLATTIARSVKEAALRWAAALPATAQ